MKKLNQEARLKMFTYIIWDALGSIWMRNVFSYDYWSKKEQCLIHFKCIKWKFFKIGTFCPLIIVHFKETGVLKICKFNSNVKFENLLHNWRLRILLKIEKIFLDKKHHHNFYFGLFISGNFPFRAMKMLM